MIKPGDLVVYRTANRSGADGIIADATIISCGKVVDSTRKLPIVILKYKIGGHEVLHTSVYPAKSKAEMNPDTYLPLKEYGDVRRIRHTKTT